VCKAVYAEKEDGTVVLGTVAVVQKEVDVDVAVEIVQRCWGVEGPALTVVQYLVSITEWA
jgi:hypothetical protein